MDTLKRLTPAETLVLRDTSRTSFKDLLKFTLLDLILKQVLIISTEASETELVEGENPVTYKNLEKGPAFDDYNYKAHELIYLAPFQQDPELSIQFKQLVKIGWESAKYRNHYMFKQILVSKDVVNTVKEGWFYRTFGYCKLTEDGEQMQGQVKAALAKLEGVLPSLIEKDPQGIKALIHQIHGNILLLNSFDYSLLKQVDEAFADESMEREISQDMDSAALWFFFLYSDFTDSFDTEYNSFSNSSGYGGDGGDGGDAGDGGCSGCGGCGGCGG